MNTYAKNRPQGMFEGGGRFRGNRVSKLMAYAIQPAHELFMHTVVQIAIALRKKCPLLPMST